jgi:hypothetical protein
VSCKGLAATLFGLDRTRAILEWEAIHTALPSHPPGWRPVLVISVNPAFPQEPEPSIQPDGRRIIQPDHQSHAQNASPPEEGGKPIHERDSDTAASMRRSHGDGVEFGAGLVVHGECVADDVSRFLRNEKQTVLRCGEVIGEVFPFPSVAPKRRPLDPHDGRQVVVGRSPDAQSVSREHALVAELASSPIPVCFGRVTTVGLPDVR